jgi:hypothetical protein
MSTEIVWRGMTRAQLDAAYNNGLAVPNSPAIVADWEARSARLRTRLPQHLDLRYGPRPRNRIDLFKCGASDAPLLVFIHGGYWQHRAKETFSFIAEGPMAHGFDVALVGYTLAPEVTVTAIAEETQRAIRWLRQESAALGAGRGRLIVAGWSAGGHLTALAMDLAEVDAGLSISGIFDLEPCRLNYLNEKLKLTPAEVAQISPIRRLPARANALLIAYGMGELPELQRQSVDYHAARAARGLPGGILPLNGDDHFSIMEKLADPGGELATVLTRLV